MKRKSPRRSTRKTVIKSENDLSLEERGTAATQEDKTVTVKCESTNILPNVVTSNNSTHVMNKASSVKQEEIEGRIEKEEKPNKKRKIKKESQSLRPTPGECEYVTSSLGRLHPETVCVNDTRRKTLLESCGMMECITDAIVSTMLSQNTTDANSKAAFKALKAKFKNWEDVASCEDITELEDCIRVAGLAKTRAERIQAILQTVKKERGRASLDYVKDILLDDDVKKELSRFKGLGPKTISCVLLFALGRPEFPVDTHVLRITKQMGWIQSNDTRESAYEHLNKHVPNHLKLDLHCLLVRHGKCCHKCASRGRPQFPPNDGSKLDCPLGKVASWKGIIPKENEKPLNNTSSKVKIEDEEASKTLN